MEDTLPSLSYRFYMEARLSHSPIKFLEFPHSHARLLKVVSKQSSIKAVPVKCPLPFAAVILFSFSSHSHHGDNCSPLDPPGYFFDCIGYSI